MILYRNKTTYDTNMKLNVRLHFFRTFENETIDTYPNRKVELFVNTQYILTADPLSTRLPADEVVYLGQDLFLTLCYEEGDRPFVGKVKAYCTVCDLLITAYIKYNTIVNHVLSHRHINVLIRDFLQAVTHLSVSV